MSAAYYRGEFDNRNDRPRRRSVWVVILDILMSVFSVAAMLLSAVIFAGRHVSPENLWYFSLSGLAAPIVYMAVIVAALYWIIRWNWRFVAALGIFALLGLFHVSLYYKMDFTKQYGESKHDRNTVNVLTFNVRNLSGDNGRSTVDSVARLIGNLRPDIVCLQEMSLDENARRQLTARLKEFNGSRLFGTSACFSRFRIIDAGDIDDFEGNASGMWADVVAGDDTVRVFNVHLQTTSLTSDDREYIGSYKYISDSTRDQRVHKIARNLRDNNILRAHQARHLHGLMQESRYPVIVCGDFNDVPVSYTYRTVAHGLEDAFSRQGHGYPHTFRGLYNMLRIDYILVSPRFETVSYTIHETDLSDHYPVSARLKPVQKDKKL